MAVTSSNQIITVKSSALTSVGIVGNGTTNQKFTDPFSIQVSGLLNENLSTSFRHFAAYEWNFSTSDITTPLNITSVSSAKIGFYYQSADAPSPIGLLGVYKITSTISSSATSLYSAINSSTTLLASFQLSGNEKKKIEIDLTSVSDLDTAVTDQTIFTIGIRPITVTEEGQVLISGLTMNTGEDTPWEAASGTDISEPPYLLLTCEATPAEHPQHLMKYTTATDPGSNQSNPTASIGGFMAPNLVNTRVQIVGDVGSTQTTVNVNGSLPSSPGLSLVGSEILKYSSTSGSSLSGITRAIVPNFSYPAIVQPYPEFVHYLNVGSLFDTKPTSDLVQYRCVAIQQQSTSSWTTSYPIVILTQDSNANVQIDIGIEVPKWDVHNGTFLSGTSSGNEITSDTADSGSNLGVANYGDGYFNGGHLIVDPNGSSIGPLNYTIDSYEFNEGIATFFLESNLPTSTISAGTSFRINPAPAQTVLNEITPPNNNSGRFLGFFGDGGSNRVTLEEHGNSIYDYDVFYIWIKRTFIENKKAGPDRGAIITIMSEVVT